MASPRNGRGRRLSSALLPSVRNRLSCAGVNSGSSASLRTTNRTGIAAVRAVTGPLYDATAADTLYHATAADTLYHATAADTLYHATAADTLYHATAADTLYHATAATDTLNNTTATATLNDTTATATLNDATAAKNGPLAAAVGIVGVLNAPLKRCVNRLQLQQRRHPPNQRGFVYLHPSPTADTRCTLPRSLRACGPQGILRKAFRSVAPSRLQGL